MQYLIGKDAHKMLKRKDSDANEHARELEELRVSLVSELRTSEGAKRQQQQFCGPSVALTFNFLVSVGIILMNKLVLGKVGFNYPIALSLIHYLVSWAFMAVLNSVSLLPAAPSAKATPVSTLVALSIVMAFSTGLANVSLKYNSVGFYQMAKIAVTPTIVFAEFLVLGKRVSFQKGLTLAAVSVGIAIASVTDLHFHFFGALVAVAWIIPSAINKVLWANLQQRDSWTALANANIEATYVTCKSFLSVQIAASAVCLSMSVKNRSENESMEGQVRIFRMSGLTMDSARKVYSWSNEFWGIYRLIDSTLTTWLMWKTTPVTVFSLVALMPWLDPPGILKFEWTFANTSAILTSAIFGFLLQWSGALALGATSAITHVVLGQFKTCVIMLAGYVLFCSNPGLKSLAGATLALGGMAIYTYLGIKKKQLKDEAVDPPLKQLASYTNGASLKPHHNKLNRLNHGDLQDGKGDFENV